MKRLMVNISDMTYEKLRFEAIQQKKSIEHLIAERIFFKPFSLEVEKAVDDLMTKQIKEI